tara:strand:- start:412 stop:774 length:363 start_codon:yes stop_codon:yes gene_type:complete
MKNINPVWKLLVGYLLLIGLLLVSNGATGQVIVTEFNAGWNEGNKAEWVKDLSDCNITYVDITKSPKIQQKHNVIVVPTIIIFNADGDEVKRWQADLSFKMVATKEEIQDYIDEMVLSDF